MAEHTDVYLKDPVPLPVGVSYIGGYTEDHEAVVLSFRSDEWKKTDDDFSLSFSETDRTVHVPLANVALVEVWED